MLQDKEKQTIRIWACQTSLSSIGINVQVLFKEAQTQQDVESRTAKRCLYPLQHKNLDNIECLDNRSLK